MDEVSEIEADLLRDRLRQLTEYHAHLDVLISSVLKDYTALVVAIGAAAFFIDPESASLGAFLLIYASGVPALALVGMLMWAGFSTTSSSTMHQVRSLRCYYPDVRWPPTEADMRAAGLIPGRNFFHKIAASTLFVGTSCIAIWLALVRAQEWREGFGVAGAVAVVLGVVVVLVELGVLWAMNRRLSGFDRGCEPVVGSASPMGSTGPSDPEPPSSEDAGSRP